MKKIYYYKRHVNTRRSRRILALPFFLLVSLLLIASSSLFYFRSPKHEEVLAIETREQIPAPVPTIYNDVLKQSVENALRGTSGSYGIVVKNLGTGEHYEFNEHVTYETASLYKLWVMAVVFKQIEDGKLKPGTILSQNVSALNNSFNISSDAAGLQEGSITLTVDQALTKMITVSDNYAAMLLTQKVGLTAISSFVSENGFFETKIGKNVNLPKTTPYDVSLFLEKLYKGELGNKENTEKMLTLLKGQQLNGKIPRYLPGNIIVAHKTGELDEFTHDAGFIFNKKGNFLIVVMSKSDHPDLAENRIAEISKAIYSHYIDKNN